MPSRQPPGITTASSANPLDDRACVLLKTLVESYIAEGAPVGSRVLSRASGLDLSAATVRNVMADLEDLGFIASPHTSAGRIPTPRGYRFFVDSLLTMQPLEQMDHARILAELASAKAQPGQIINQASRLLSDLTQFAGIVIAPRHPSTRIRQIEFIALSDQRVLLVLVTSDGNVQNRILTTDRAYSSAELIEAANTLNQNFVGLELEQMRHRVHDELTRIRADMQALMAAGLARASAVVVTYLDVPAALKVLNHTQSHAPQVPVIVRTKDDLDLDKLQQAGATEVVPEALEGSLMLASHALALVGVPMRRVIRAVQEQRDARYNLLKGYFHGADDDTLEELEHERLTTVSLPLASPWLGRVVADLNFHAMGVRLANLRRASGKNEPVNDTVELQMGDTLVLSGNARALALAEEKLLRG